MANLLKTADKSITLSPNIVLLRYLRALIRTGLYGAGYPQVVEELLRQRITQLIDEDKLSLQDEELNVEGE